MWVTNSHPLFLATRIVFWGKHMASKNHLLLVFENFNKNQHGLLEENINVKDKQNFPTVRQIVFPKVLVLKQLMNVLFMKECNFTNMSKVQFYVFKLFKNFGKFFMVKEFY
jgi:hypothetical protein